MSTYKCSSPMIMHIKCMTIATTILIFLIIWQVATCEARPPAAPFVTGIRMAETIAEPGRVQLEFFFKAEDDFGQLKFVVVTSGELTLIGDDNWQDIASKNDSLSRYLDIDIPSNDTCGIEVQVYNQGSLLTGNGIFFITTENNLQIVDIDPRSQAFKLRQLPVRTENEYHGKKLP